jgi:STAS-like domain of unknown function (DUF4325)
MTKISSGELMVRRKVKIENFLLENISNHPEDISALAIKRFKTSRQNIQRYLARLVSEGKIAKIGHTKGTKYYLNTPRHIKFAFDDIEKLDENEIWKQKLLGAVSHLPENVKQICHYGFTEIFNNAIDHSEGRRITTDFQIKYGKVRIDLIDDGIGIFKKIQNHFNLPSIREAILHLSKGKVTTDSDNHTGEGIFFSSRVFDKFSIFSGEMYYERCDDGSDWFLAESTPDEKRKGTLVSMEVSVKSQRTIRQVFDQYSDPETDEPGFHSTRFSVQLAKDKEENYVSRSQAKRVMAGLEKFRSITLDFRNVTAVGQGFADQVFRVFQSQYPKIKIEFVNANADVQFMIRRSIAPGKPE